MGARCCPSLIFAGEVKSVFSRDLARYSHARRAVLEAHHADRDCDARVIFDLREVHGLYPSSRNTSSASQRSPGSQALA
jgi:hypothetical protein